MNNQKGYTLLEVLFSLSLLGLFLGGLAPAFVAQFRFNTINEWRSGAQQVAQRKMDELRQQEPGTLPTSGSTGPETITTDGRDFEVTTYWCEESTYCSTGDNRHIRVAITYQGRVLYNVETVFTALR